MFSLMFTELTSNLSRKQYGFIQSCSKFFFLCAFYLFYLLFSMSYSHALLHQTKLFLLIKPCTMMHPEDIYIQRQRGIHTHRERKTELGIECFLCIYE